VTTKQQQLNATSYVDTKWYDALIVMPNHSNDDLTVQVCKFIFDNPEGQ